MSAQCQQTRADLADKRGRARWDGESPARPRVDALTPSRPARNPPSGRSRRLRGDGVTSTTTDDILSRPATANDGKAAQTSTHDTGAENRGLLTQVVDSQAGHANA